MQHFPTARQDADWLDDTKAERPAAVPSLPDEARLGSMVCLEQESPTDDLPDGVYIYLGNGRWDQLDTTQRVAAST